MGLDPSGEVALSPPKLHIGELYTNATDQELDKLHKVSIAIHLCYTCSHIRPHQMALLLFDCGPSMLEALPKDMKHLRKGKVPPPNQESVDDSCYFYWAKEGPAIHAFDGTTHKGPSTSHACIGNNLSPFRVSVSALEPENEDLHISSYAQAVAAVVQHPHWQTALFKILQVDQLLTPGKPWFLNPYATVTPAPVPTQLLSSQSSAAKVTVQQQDPPTSQSQSDSSQVLFFLSCISQMRLFTLSFARI